MTHAVEPRPVTSQRPAVRRPWGLVLVSAVVGVAAVFGAAALIRDDYGMPVAWLEPLPFDALWQSWVLPGILLGVLVGGSMLTVAILGLMASPSVAPAGIVAGLGLVAWIGVQLLVFEQTHPIQPVCVVLGLVVAGLAWRYGRWTRHARA